MLNLSKPLTILNYNITNTRRKDGKYMIKINNIVVYVCNYSYLSTFSELNLIACVNGYYIHKLPESKNQIKPAILKLKRYLKLRQIENS